MQVAFTARKGKISKALRTQAEEGMERIGRILGRTARASVTFSAQRHVHIVELTIHGPLAEDSPPRAKATRPMRRCARPSNTPSIRPIGTATGAS